MTASGHTAQKRKNLVAMMTVCGDLHLRFIKPVLSLALSCGAALALHGQAITNVGPYVAIGESPLAVYDVGEVDNVNPVNGNVYINLPLFGYPQLGHSLRMNFRIYNNDKRWFILGYCQEAVVDQYPNPCTGQQANLWTWTGIGNEPSSLWPAIMGVYVARDQHLDLDTDDRPTSYTSNTGNYEGYQSISTVVHVYSPNATGPDGAKHYLGDWEYTVCTAQGAGSCPNAPYQPSNTYPASDGSGYIPGPVGVIGPDGVSYTVDPATKFETIVDNSNNAITQNANGWTDTLGRIIPGSLSGPGTATALDYYSSTLQSSYEPIPGVPTKDTSHCPAGLSQVQAREWQVPSFGALGAATQTYYLCYANWNFKTQFNLGQIFPGNSSTGIQGSPFGGITEASGTSVLLSAIVLPNGTSYTFSYDQYLSLAKMTLPTGGEVNYTWQTVPFDMNNGAPEFGPQGALYLPNPAFRAIATKTVTPGNNQPARTWTYHWYFNPTGPGITQGFYNVPQTAWSIVTDPEGNDTERQLGGSDDAGNVIPNGFATKVSWYQGCSPHDNGAVNAPASLTNSPSVACKGASQLLKTESYVYTNVNSGGYAGQSVAALTGENLVATTTTTTVQTGSSVSLVSKEVKTLSPAYGTCTVQPYATAYEYQTPQTVVVAPRPVTLTPCYQHNQFSTDAIYDFGVNAAGPLLRTTTTNYLWNNPADPLLTSSLPYLFGIPNTSYIAANLVDLPSSTITGPGTGSANASETYYHYDESPSPGGAIGNQTSVTRVSNVGPSSETHVVYNAQGMRTSLVDANGNTTGIVYDSTGAFPQTVTSPTTSGIAHVDKYVFEPTTGQTSSYTDQNHNTTNFSYIDPATGAVDKLNRLHKVTRPPTFDATTGTTGSGYTIYTYDDTPGQLAVTQQTLQNASNTQLTSVTSFDGMGDKIHEQTTSDPYGTVNVDTNYDSLGRVLTVSNPYRSMRESTYGITTNTYDAIGRTVMVAHPDGSAQSFCYNGIPIAGQSSCPENYSSRTGQWTDTYDEVGNHTQRVSDGLGRLTTVMEPDSSNTPGLETDYQYDALNNLLSVSQNGISGGAPRRRSFTYDSLSRLLTSTNPETGNICYGLWSGGAVGAGTCQNGYDPNGNLLYKTDARGFTTAYQYDALNRITQSMVPILNAAGVVTGVVQNQFQFNCSQYDTLSGASSGANLIGHPVAEWTQRGSTGSSCDTSYTPSDAVTAKLMLTYDAMGRLLLSQQCVSTMCTTNPFVQSQKYDLAGDMTSWMDGRGYMTFTQGFDAAGRSASLTNSVNGSGLPSVLFSVQGYTPAGALQNWNIGGFLNAARDYDSRLRVTSESVTH